MRIFFVELKDDKVYFNESDTHHVTCVLRKKIGSKVKCCYLTDNIFFDAKIISTKPLIGTIDKFSIKKHDEKNIDITCYLGVIKKSNFELAVEKLNEIGIKKVVPVVFERSQNNIHLDFLRINKICFESSKQCNRVNPIIVENITSFLKITKNLETFNIVFVANMSTDSVSFSNWKYQTNNRVAYVIGPEGGFSQKEIEVFKKIRKLIFLKLTDNILKTETAAIYLASILYERVANEK